MTDRCETEKLITMLMSKGLTLGSVESMTGGLFAGEVTRIPHASEVFKGGLVTYVPELKTKFAGVKEETLKRYGAVSWPVVKEMAVGGRKALGVDLCLAVTGNAGPSTDSGNEEVGRVYLALATSHDVWGAPLELKGDRSSIRSLTVRAMLSFVLAVLQII